MRGVSVIPRAVSLRVSISQSTGILGIPLPALLSNIRVFLWRNHKNMNTVFRLVGPVYDMDTYIFKAHVFTTGYIRIEQCIRVLVPRIQHVR